MDSIALKDQLNLFKINYLAKKHFTVLLPSMQQLSYLLTKNFYIISWFVHVKRVLKFPFPMLRHFPLRAKLDYLERLPAAEKEHRSFTPKFIWVKYLNVKYRVCGAKGNEIRARVRHPMIQSLHCLHTSFQKVWNLEETCLWMMSNEINSKLQSELIHWK
jgi:hypothetical protein